MKKCECPITSRATDKALYMKEEYITMQHEPNKCKGKYGLKKYKRNNKDIWLCSACNLPGDVEK